MTRQSLFFPSTVDLTDWLLLIRVRGQIMCEIHFDDGLFGYFEVRREELKELSVNALIEVVNLKSKACKPSKSQRDLLTIPTLIVWTDSAAA